MLLMAGNAIAELGALQANLNKLARVPSRIAATAAQGITIQIHLDTASGLDAYGKPFAPLAVSTLRRGRRQPPMVATGQSLDETRAYPLGGAGIAVVLGGAYKHHVRGYKTRPSRSVVPERSVLPASWNKRLKAAETKAVTDACPELKKK
jgi:hypothetical protein